MNSIQDVDFLIVGGGAAGFFAAITAAETHPGIRVAIVEKGREVLQKVKVSGGGRCNVTHACFDNKELVKNYPRGHKALLGPFSRFAPGDTIAWFHERGVHLKVEEDGRMFPVTDSSQTIIDCLLGAARRAGVQVLTGTNMSHVKPPTGGIATWQVSCQSGEVFSTKKIMLATGSSPRVWQLLAELGHTIVPPVPSLFTFHINDPRLAGLAGVATPTAEIRFEAEKLTTKGPLLITHWGLSGPAALRMSAWGARAFHQKNYQFGLTVNWLGLPADLVLEDLNDAKQALAKKLVVGNCPFPTLPKRLWERLCLAADVLPTLRWADVSKEKTKRLAGEIAAGQFAVSGKSTFKEEFVTAGGVDLDEVDFKKFESKKLRGLFLAGEVLDIDAITGGFNFQAAWTGGYLAGKTVF